MADENKESEVSQKIPDERELTEVERQKQFEIAKSALSRAS